MKLLEKNKHRWLGSREIADTLHMPRVGSVLYSLKRLRKTDHIKFRIVTRRGFAGRRFEYKYTKHIKEKQ